MNEQFYVAEHQPDPPDAQPWWLPWVLRIVGVVAILSLGVIGWGIIRGIVEDFADSVGVSASDSEVAFGTIIEFTIPDGASARSIASILRDRGVIINSRTFEKEVIETGVANQLRAGTYTMPAGSSYEEVVALLTEGPPAAEVYKLTVIEGLRIEEMLASISEVSGHSVAVLEAALVSGDVTSEFLPDSLPDGTPPLTAWEGLLAPDTYEFVVGSPPAEVLQTLATTLEGRLEAQDWSDLEDAGYTPYEGLVIASLIEKEAKLEEDRPLISSVIANRLDAGIALQLDATVIYALGENPGRVLESDLQIDSPWNTYRVAGLPPTPIGGVRVSSLEAAASPAQTQFFYYVLVSVEGKHGFSETLEGHNAKVAKARADGVLP
ncbi:MAG: endolytic transglycosylase MltG [Acidobacteria bacterium]|nr:endolytic transglycosylase MltG [Acidobacteriota bacterium]